MCSRFNCESNCPSNSSRLCPSTPPLPRFALTHSQAISRFFCLYTLSINEWTFLAPVGLIQSTSLLGAGRTGISLMELIHLPAPFSSGFLSFPNRLRRLPSPTHFRRRLPGHAAFTALVVLHSRPSTGAASLATSLGLNPE